MVATDDTPLKVQAKKKTHLSRDWVYLDLIRRMAVFDYTPSRSRDGPVKFLGSFAGYLQADAYVGYDAIFANKTVKEVACWAHARRKFDEAKSVQPEAALAAMAWIKRLYDVEREAKAYAKELASEGSVDERRALLVAKRRELRQAKSVAILDRKSVV